MIVVNNGGTLRATINDCFGGTAQYAPPIILNNSTRRTTRYNSINDLTLNGSTVTGTVSDGGNYAGWQIGNNVTVGGSSVSTMSMQDGKNFYLRAPATVFKVADATGNANAAFAMECYEEGIITREHTGGLELNFGNGAAALELLHQMARGDGFGVIVGQGVRYMKEYFAREFCGDPVFMHDIGMEIKGMEISEYLTKESLAQEGGYGLATKGPQHDEAWLIFMDQVHNLLPSFQDKAEALHYFPMWRTWFSLHGLCKLPWNDIYPANNKQTKEPAKVEEHVENYTWIHEGETGKPTKVEHLLAQSERVYNFQKVFARRMGRVGRQHALESKSALKARRPIR